MLVSTVTGAKIDTRSGVKGGALVALSSPLIDLTRSSANSKWLKTSVWNYFIDLSIINVIVEAMG